MVILVVMALTVMAAVMRWMSCWLSQTALEAADGGYELMSTAVGDVTMTSVADPNAFCPDPDFIQNLFCEIPIVMLH